MTTPEEWTLHQQWVRHIIAKRHTTQRGLARAMQIEESRLSRVVCGKAGLTTSQWQALAVVADVTHDAYWAGPHKVAQ